MRAVFRFPSPALTHHNPLYPLLPPYPRSSLPPSLSTLPTCLHSQPALVVMSRVFKKGDLGGVLKEKKKGGGGIRGGTGGE